MFLHISLCSSPSLSGSVSKPLDLPSWGDGLQPIQRNRQATHEHEGCATSCQTDSLDAPQLSALLLLAYRPSCVRRVSLWSLLRELSPRTRLDQLGHRTNSSNLALIQAAISSTWVDHCTGIAHMSAKKKSTQISGIWALILWIARMLVQIIGEENIVCISKNVQKTVVTTHCCFFLLFFFFLFLLY